jgi:uncharacterized membrane protein
MQGKASIFGHPIHPMLIPFPIGFFVGALVCDIISHFSSAAFWPTLSVVMIGFGIISALLAAIFGFVDYFTAPMPADAKKIATTHMLLNLGAVIVFIIAFFVRYGHTPTAAGYVLTVVGVIVLAITGSLGGHLSYHYGVGVDDRAVPPKSATLIPR